MLSHSPGFIELTKAVGVDFIAESTQRFLALLSDVGPLLLEDASLALDGHRVQRVLEPVESLLDGLHLPADQDFADAFDLTSSL